MNNKVRNFAQDYAYMTSADIHAGEGGKLGEQAAVSILNIGLFWMERQRWRSMNDPELEKVKVAGKRILVFVPRKSVPKGEHFRLELPPRVMFAHWSQAAEVTKAITPSKHSIVLENKHGGFWASDKRGIRPLKGAPAMWMYEPEVEGVL